MQEKQNFIEEQISCASMERSYLNCFRRYQNSNSNLIDTFYHEISKKNSLPLYLPQSHKVEKEESPSRRQKNDIQLNAKNMLMEESETFHQNRIGYPYQTKNKLSDIEVYQPIRGFYQEKYPSFLLQTKPKQKVAGSGPKVVHIVRRERAWNQRNKKKPCLNKKINLSQQTLTAEPEQINKNSITTTIRALLLNKDVTKIKSRVDEVSMLNKNFIKLQQNYRAQRKVRSKTTPLRCKTEMTDEVKGEKAKILSIKNYMVPFDERKPKSKLKEQKRSNSSQEIYQSIINGKRFEKKETISSLDNKDIRKWQEQFQEKYISPTRHGGVNLVKSKMGNIFKKLKEIKERQQGLYRYSFKEDPQTKKSLHNIHDRQERIEAGTKYKWEHQRNKIKNYVMKTETADLNKLSRGNEESRRSRSIQFIQEQKPTKNQKYLLRILESRRTGSNFNTASPIFMTENIFRNDN